MATLPPQTPQRPLPGGWTNTPAPQRPPPFPFSFPSEPTQAVSGSSQSLPPQQATGQNVGLYPQLPPNVATSADQSVPQATSVEQAARTINDLLARDARYPALDNYIGQGISTSNDYDTPSSAAWTPFQRVKIYDIPERILSQYNQAKFSAMMGLFADINHAWISLDNAIYLWDYTDPNPEVIGFEDQPNTITAVSLVKPRAGVFVEQISQLLVLATTSEILLIGLAIQTSPQGAKQVSMYHTRMSISIRGVDVQSIAGSSATGRIFFGGHGDDDVYELTYQQEEGWFSSRCAKFNHTRKGMQNMLPVNPFAKKATPEHLVQIVVDDSRKYLYTLSSLSTIRVFHMKDLQTLDLCITKSYRDLKFDLSHKVGPSANFEDSSIVALSAVTASEASRMNLVAVTSKGCRIYFNTVSSGGYYGSEPSGPPSSMMVHHIRFAPKDPQAIQAPQQFTQVPAITTNTGAHAPADFSSPSLTTTRSGCRFAPGYFFCYVEKQGNPTDDTFFMSAPDSGKIAQVDGATTWRFPEAGQFLTLGGRTQDIGLVTKPFAAASSPLGFGNELAVQFDFPSSEIAVLTDSGIHTFRRRRLVDVFAASIKSGGGDEGLDGEIRLFVRNYGRAETVATALAVACGQGSEVSADSRVVRVAEPEILEYARKAFVEQGGKAMLNENSIIDRNASAIDNVRPSPRAEGLALYISRLLRSVWKAKLVEEKIAPGAPIQMLPTVPLSKLQDIQRDLTRLQQFLKANENFIEGLSGPEALGRVSTTADEIALQGEHRALTNLVRLISDVIEGISFVLVLFDEHADEILLSISEQARTLTKNSTYENLFCTKQGKDLAKELVKAIVNRNIAQGSNVDTVTDALRRRCGSFCSADDCLIFKAQEQLKRAADSSSSSEMSRGLLNESLRLLQKVASSLSPEQLQWAIERYTELQFFAGAIQLALTVAQDSDKADRALAWYHEGSPAQDSRASLFQKRLECYQLIHGVIVAVDKAGAGVSDMEDGVYTALGKRRREALEIINTSQDEVFQITLYDWYLSQGWDDRILDVKSPFVVSYLQRKARVDAASAVLLYRYYASYNYFLEAAKVQLDLAKSEFVLSLDQRVEYLSLARANASTKAVGLNDMNRNRQSRQELLREITDMLEVANIQIELLQRLKSDERLSGDKRVEVVSSLSGSIQSIDVLFNQYADQAGYHDICILIYQAAGYRNAGDIRASWQSLIESLHGQAEAEKQLPYELIAERVTSLGSRLALSDSTFPVPALLPMIKKYSYEHQRDVAPQTWVVDLFLNLSVPYETIVLPLEAMFYNEDIPFRGRNKRYVATDLLYAISRWLTVSSNEIGGGFGLANMRGGKERAELFGSIDTALQIRQVLDDLFEGGGFDQGQQSLCTDMKRKIDDLMPEAY